MLGHKDKVMPEILPLIPIIGEVVSQSGKMLLLFFICSSFVLLLTLSSIASGQIDFIHPWALILWVCCIGCIVSRAIVWVWEFIFLQKIRQHKQKKRIKSLSQEERHILSRVISAKTGGAWVPLENAASLTLLQKRIIVQISRVCSWKNWDDDELSEEYCLLVEIPEGLKKYVFDAVNDIAISDSSSGTVVNDALPKSGSARIQAHSESS